MGPDLLKKESYLLRPGESRVIERKSDQATVAIGVLAGYRDLGKSVWRAVYRLKDAPETAWYRALIPANKTHLDIRLEERGITITEVRK
ncbi:type VI secretion system lipoprotein TssJ [Thauera sinica]|uniref:Type VI secretion system lipoprotein TssJ n=1 Tax=Thauera sinica TaxID=2665146 RepID=A0ABW1ATY6_9RHOO|nr:type VI secretion system lipoprotein TssJ [Thauera sp. K11]